jgi:hypothetical protein
MHKGSAICSYTHIACTDTIDQNLYYDDFKSFYALITSSPKLKAYAIEIYTNLSKFLVSWDMLKKFKFIPLVGTKCTPPTC